jgi:hypothetical protein
VGRAARAVDHSEAAGSDVCSLQALVRMVPTVAQSLSYLGGEQSLKHEKSRIVSQGPEILDCGKASIFRNMQFIL